MRFKNNCNTSDYKHSRLNLTLIDGCVNLINFEFPFFEPTIEVDHWNLIFKNNKFNDLAKILLTTHFQIFVRSKEMNEVKKYNKRAPYFLDLNTFVHIYKSDLCFDNYFYFSFGILGKEHLNKIKKNNFNNRYLKCDCILVNSNDDTEIFPHYMIGKMSFLNLINYDCQPKNNK